MRGEGGLIVGAGSRHQSGREYAWELEHHPDDTPIADAPTWLLDRIKQAQGAAEGKGPAPPIPGKISHGRQHDTLVSLGGSMRARGMVEEEIFAALWLVNQNLCERPGPAANIRQIAASIMNYSPQEARPSRIRPESADATEPQPDLEARFAVAEAADGIARLASLGELAEAVAAANLPSLAVEGWLERVKAAGLAAKGVFRKAVQEAGELARRQPRVLPAEEDGPTICVSRRHLHEITNQALARLQEANAAAPFLFRQGTALVRVVRNSPVQAEALTVTSLRGILDRAAKFVRCGEGGEFVPARPPVDVVKDLMELPELSPAAAGDSLRAHVPARGPAVGRRRLRPGEQLAAVASLAARGPVRPRAAGGAATTPRRAAP